MPGERIDLTRRQDGRRQQGGCYSWQRLWRAMKVSLAGWRVALAETAIRQELAMAVVLMPAAFLVGGSPFERAILIGAVLLVIVVELLNTAIEAVVDLVSPEYHVLAKQAKDLGSAAVLLSLIILAIVWLTALFW